MAKLISEDKDFPSSIELIPLSIKSLHLASEDKPQEWQTISLNFKSGQFNFSLPNVESSLICRSPNDEIKTLVDFLEKLLNHQQNKVIFEPHEPNFDFSFDRTPDDGIFVHAWLDATNSTTDFYSGDALGIRFHTSNKLLAQFIDDLKGEFKI